MYAMVVSGDDRGLCSALFVICFIFTIVTKEEENLPGLEILTRDAYQRAKAGKPTEFFRCDFSTPAKLVGIGAPTKLFLEEVGALLGTEVITSPYSPVTAPPPQR